MRIHATHRGRHLPFERDRQLVLRCLPTGFRVRSATVTVTPVADDPDGRFLETLRFVGPSGDWGAVKTSSAGGVEVHLRARRTLAAVRGSGLEGAAVLVDLGGGFVPVDAAGGLGGTGPLVLETDAADLPGHTVTGLRLAPITTPDDVHELQVSSPPTNVSLAFAGGPTFFFHLGPMVTPVTSPDVADLLQAALDAADVVHGHHVLRLAVHSDTIARLDVSIDLDVGLAVSATPARVGRVTLPYGFSGRPEVEGSPLSITVPPGMVAVAGATTGRVRGAFEATRVVHGPVATTEPDVEVPVTSGGPLAQPLLTMTAVAADAIDLQVAAVTAEVELAVDVVGDLDGKPDRVSVLPRPATVRLTRDQAPGPTWISVPLPAELATTADTRLWIVVQARTGAASWAAHSAEHTTQPALHATRDGGLSWRQIAGVGEEAVDARFRLRAATRTFHVPLELQVRGGGSTAVVPLDRFDPQGAVDFDLGFDAVTDAVNTMLRATPAGRCPTGEHLGNGDFSEWLRIGTALALDRPLGARPFQGNARFPVAVFGRDGATVHAIGNAGGDRSWVVQTFDTRCGEPLWSIDLEAGDPSTATIDAAGQTLLIVAGEDDSTHSLLYLVDTATRRTIGSIPVHAMVTALAVSPDGDSVYLASGPSDYPRSHLTSDSTTLHRCSWSDLRAAAPVEQPLAEIGVSTSVTMNVVALAVTRDGSVVLLSDGGEGRPSELHVRDADLSDRSGTLPGVRSVANPRWLAARPTDDEVLVLGTDELERVRVKDLVTIGTSKVQDGHRVAVDPTGAVALVLSASGCVAALDLPRGGSLPPPVATGVESADWLAMSPTGTHAAVAGGAGGAVQLVRIGDAVPSRWELTLGNVQPLCVGVVPRPVAVLGRRRKPRQTPVIETSAISQTSSAVGGCAYRFAFAGLGEFAGGVAELIWRNDACGLLRTDTVAVTPWSRDSGGGAELAGHEQRVIAPEAASQVEVRFTTPEGLMAVDAVTLAGVAEGLTNSAVAVRDGAADGWELTDATARLAASGSAAGTQVRNSGARAAALTQTVPAHPGDEYRLTATVRLTGTGSAEPAAVELAFLDELGVVAGPPVRIDVDARTFDGVVTVGQVPAAVSDAEISILVPPGGTVEVDEVSLALGAPSTILLDLVADAPGEVTVGRVDVGLDVRAPEVAPDPPGGLCPATPPGRDTGDPATCYCAGCGTTRPVRESRPLADRQGRPGSVTPCPSCGRDRVRVGGRAVSATRDEGPPRFRVAGWERQLPVVPPSTLVRVDEPLDVISGISHGRERALRAAGIDSIPALAAADLARLTAIRGVSMRMARDFVREARVIVREQGYFEPFNLS
jgi:DNA-binding beta-propeller fold protein YncE